MCTSSVVAMQATTSTAFQRLYLRDRQRLRTQASVLIVDREDVADLLQESLDEESSSDRKLTSLAEGGLFSTGLNTNASHAGESRV